MFCTHAPAAALAERMCRPQRVGLFGNRGVGKTTLLTMLYREAVGGRLPGLRLAAADARTADYLAEKIHSLEAGEPLPATLAETELRFHLYHGNTRLELLMKDYQGEHISLGSREPIWEFLRDCDAVLLCLDAGTLSQHAERRRCQQEVEQLIEDYLAQEPQRTMDRPVALVLTKADLVGQPAEGRSQESGVRNQGSGLKSQGLEAGVHHSPLTNHHSPIFESWPQQFDMIRHAVEMHCPNSGAFAVSSLGSDWKSELRPSNLADPLVWLASALQAQDEARLERLFTQGGAPVSQLDHCVSCFARRYPAAPATKAFQERLRQVRRQQVRRRSLAAAALTACTLAGLWTYDALGHHNAARYEEEHDDPAAVLEHWQEYQAWHPTRFLMQASTPEAEEECLQQLRQQVRDRERDERLAELRRRATDPDGDPEAVWKQFQDFRAAYPEVNLAGDLEKLRGSIKARRDEQVRRRAQLAFDELVFEEQRSKEWDSLLARSSRLLRDFPGSAHEADVRRRQTAYLQRIDERDIQAARDYSAKQPLNFQTRREHYQHYLDRHPAGGAFTQEALSALQTIQADWDKHSFRQVRDHFLAKPGDLRELTARCRGYLAVHPSGRFKNSATELLRWGERVTAPGDYRVTLKWGSFDKKVAYFFSRGPDLSVELEVAGVRYGPSPVIANNYGPEWDYEFPRKIRWKLGDPVTIRVTDHDWKNRVVVELAAEEGDPLGIRLLSGECWSGPNQLMFESDFTMPKLPKIE